ncbi:nucleosidase [Aeromicrobium piscarium]|uniref:Nucleosidase n=1 Tax=Aeromicrobium piscarium TaxID=2590901 RepID=A0A554S8Q9_9ACTN|nr:nucleosidase [Aeromicrobium piscarium]TSD62725.1 nucleosidase [Aeromicrobium piscarium]
MTTLVVAALASEAAHVPPGIPLAITGIGKVEAASATARAIAHHRPSRIVNIGTAGALRTGLHGIFLPSRAINHDLDAPSIRALGAEAVDEIAIEDGDGTVLATGDRFVSDAAVRDVLAQRASLVDMEGFAVARAAGAMDVPVRLVKVVSDAADESALEWPQVVERCARQLGDWLRTHL